MKKLISLLVCTLILGAPAANAQRSGVPWSRYTIKGEDFAVALPRVPAVQTSKETRPRPQKDRKRYVIKTSAAGIVFTIHVVENPEPRLSLETFIQEQAMINPAEKLTAGRDLTVDGIAGKTFVYPDGKGMVQFFATQDRLYDVCAYGASVDDPRIKQFFSYLSLKKIKGSYEVSESVQSESLDTAVEKVYTSKEVDIMARLISKPEPTYSDKAQSARTTGTVVIKCIFAADGTITNIYVVEGLPNGLTEKVIEAARKIKFVPATKDGKNVSTWMQLVYNFDIFTYR